MASASASASSVGPVVSSCAISSLPSSITIPRNRVSRIENRNQLACVSKIVTAWKDQMQQRFEASIAQHNTWSTWLCCRRRNVCVQDRAVYRNYMNILSLTEENCSCKDSQLCGEDQNASKTPYHIFVCCDEEGREQGLATAIVLKDAVYDEIYVCSLITAPANIKMKSLPNEKPYKGAARKLLAAIYQFGQRLSLKLLALTYTFEAFTFYRNTVEMDYNENNGSFSFPIRETLPKSLADFA
jgi:hypothetical protein